SIPLRSRRTCGKRSAMELARDAYIDGAWQQAHRRFPVRDPFDDAVIADVADCDDALIANAIPAAVRAFGSQQRRPAGERGKLLSQVGARMLADERRLAELCTRENGKPTKEAIAEVRYAASFLTWFGSEAERMYGEIIPASHVGQRLMAI